MEDAETVPAARMHDIVAELAELGVLRADIGVKGGSGGRILKIEPGTVPLRASAVIAAEDVVWVSNPEAGRSLVSVEETV